VLLQERQKERKKEKGDEEQDVNSYWVILRKRKDIGL
jgi:hypothetical protein